MSDQRDENIERVELEQLWVDISRGDVVDCGAKLTEYGAHDLLLMGESLIGDHPRVKALRNAGEHGEVEVMLQEAAIAFYAMGKAARLMAAYKRGEFGSGDSWKDLVTYGMMARTLRERGTF